jgi:hypothetical protein
MRGVERQFRRTQHRCAVATTNGGVGLLGLLIRFGERMAVEALLARSRRVQTVADDPAIGATIVVSVLLLPVFFAFFVAWLVTGRGPAVRYLTWYAGAPLQRPPA